MNFASLHAWFLLLGVAGTTYLVLRVAALLLGGVIGDHGDGGGADHGDAGFGDHGDGGGHGDVGDHGDADLPDHGDAGDAGGDHADDSGHHEGTRWLTLQGMAAFAMGFGWLGLSLLAVVPAFVALVLAALFGTACAAGFGWVVGRLPRLESSGTFRASRCVGQVGTVYRRIPAGGQGAVQVEAQGRLVTMDATADEEIPTGRRVLVFDVTREHVLRVEAWQDDDTNPAGRAVARRGRGEA